MRSSTPPAAQPAAPPPAPEPTPEAVIPTESTQLTSQNKDKLKTNRLGLSELRTDEQTKSGLNVTS